jgi:hypothetical protein
MVMDAATLFTGTDVRAIGPALAVHDMAETVIACLGEGLYSSR